MRDPSVLDPKIRAYLEAENDYAEGRAGAHRASAGDAVRRDEGAHQGGRLHGAEPGRPLSPISRAIARAASIRSCAASRAAAGPSRCCSTATRWRPARPSSSSAACSTRPTIALIAWSADDTGLGISTRCACAISRPAHDLPTSIPDVAGLAVWTADSSAFYYVRLDENHRPSRVYRHRLGTPAADDALVYEEPDSRFFVALGAVAVPPLRRHFGARSRNIGMLAARPRRTRRQAAAGRGARNRRCSTTSSIIPNWARRRDAGDPHQCGQGARTSRSLVTPLARPGARELARSRAAPARHLRARHHGALRLADPARARGRPAAHRGAAARRAARSTRSRFPRRPIRSAPKAATSS